MEAILASIVSALVAGAVAKAKDVASDAVSSAYEGLKSLIVKKLGKGGAVQSVEDDPKSESARATLIENLSKQRLYEDSEVQALAQRLDDAIAQAKGGAGAGSADIDLEEVRAGVNATVRRLQAEGHIKVGPVIAETGDATVEDLVARKKG